MSLELIIRWEDGDTSALEHGELLIDQLDEIDAIADQHDVRWLSSFADDRDIPEDFAGDPEQLAELLGPNPIWHTPTEAAATIHQLADLTNGSVADGLRELSTLLRRDTRAFQLDVLL